MLKIINKFNEAILKSNLEVNCKSASWNVQKICPDNLEKKQYYKYKYKK